MNVILKPLLILILLISQSSIAQNTEIDFAGNWIATDYWNNESPLILSEDNYVSMSINGEFIDGKNFIIRGGKNDGKKGELKYLINTDKSPIEIDLIAILDDEEKGRILGIIQPINDNEFLMALSFDGVRDTNFDESANENFIKVKREE